MGKEKRSVSVTLRSYVKEFSVLTTDDKVLYCTVCDDKVTATKRFQVTQHLNTVRHQKCVALKSKKQTLLPGYLNNSRGESSKSIEFNKKLCSALVAADIPLSKINHSAFRNFLEEISKMPIPDESTLRKNYLPRLYEETIKSIRKHVANNYIWVSIDESTDTTGRCVETSFPSFC